MHKRRIQERYAKHFFGHSLSMSAQIWRFIMNNRYRNAARAFLVSMLMLISLESAFAAPPSQRDAVNDWSVHAVGTPHPFAPSSSQSLKNETHNECIRYGERDYGINLVWHLCPAGGVTFERESGTGSMHIAPYGRTLQPSSLAKGPARGAVEA